MKRLCLTLSLAMIGLAGCNTTPTDWDPKIDVTERQTRSTDMWTIDSALQANTTSGVITQRTIYAYYFDSGTARLTELGQRDVGILAGYFKTTPGTLNIARGDAADALYAARTATILATLKDAGVNVDQMQFVAGTPGGTGMSSQQIIDAAKHQNDALQSGTVTSSGAATGGSTGSSGESGMKGSGQ